MTKTLFPLFLLLLLPACQFAGTLVNGAHKVGVVLLDDRAFSDDIGDFKTNLEIRNNLTRQNARFALDIEITVFEGAVLLTGALPDPELINQAVETVWQTPGVARIYNYLRTAPPADIEDVNEDALISTQIRTELSFTRGISSCNYKIVMENGCVYIMGIAQDMEEVKKVVAVLKNTSGVLKIVPLIRFKDDPKWPAE